jgi:hypothetical protein
MTQAMRRQFLAAVAGKNMPNAALTAPFHLV